MLLMTVMMVVVKMATMVKEVKMAIVVEKITKESKWWIGWYLLWMNFQEWNVFLVLLQLV